MNKETSEVETIDVKLLQEQVRTLLVGQPLSDLWHPAFWVFEFGAQLPFINKSGEQATHADFRLDLSCPWRISKDRRLVMSSGDFHFDRKYQRVALPYRVTRPRNALDVEQWRLCTEFWNVLERASVYVRRVTVRPTGDIALLLSHGYRLDAWVDGRPGWMLRTPEVTLFMDVADSSEFRAQRLAKAPRP